PVTASGAAPPLVPAGSHGWEPTGRLVLRASARIIASLAGASLASGGMSSPPGHRNGAWGALEHPAIGTAGLAAPRLPLAAFSSVNSLSEAASLLGPCQGLPGTAAHYSSAPNAQGHEVKG